MLTVAEVLEQGPRAFKTTLVLVPEIDPEDAVREMRDGWLAVVLARKGLSLQRTFHPCTPPPFLLT